MTINLEELIINTEENIFLFDLCGTLNSLNNTFDFIDFVYHKKGLIEAQKNKNRIEKILKILYLLVFLPIKKISSKTYFLLDKKIRQFRIEKYYSVVSKLELEQLADIYATEFASQKINSEVIDIFKQISKENRYLVTAAPEIPVKSIAKYFDFTEENILCTTLNYLDKNRIKIALDTFFKKGGLFKELFLNNKKIILITDNIETDQDLVDISSHTILFSQNGINFYK